MRKIHVQFSNERLITPSGLTLVGTFLGKSDLVKRCNRMSITDKRSQPQIKNGDILLTYTGLLCQGKTSYESVREMEDDPEYYKYALGITREIPSAETLRLRMDEIGSSCRPEILQANVTMLNTCGIEPTALPNGYVPLDVDVTPLDNSKTKKEGVFRTYKGNDGFAPIMSYLGTEGFLINNELRIGKQHCQKGTPEFLRETLALSRQLTKKPLLVRLDGGNDAIENIGIFLEQEDVSFIIKRNLRRESKEAWLATAKEESDNVQNPREGKTVYIGSTTKEVSYTNADGVSKAVDIRVGYEIISRTIDKHGQILLFEDIEVNSWWTNLPDELSDDDIIKLYHAHGESEQFHSEIKTDMDVERLPSGKFETNELVLELTILAYNILRMIGQESLKKRDTPLKRPVRRRRLRTVIANLIQIAGHVTKHGRRLMLSLGCSNPWRHAFMRIHQRFSSA